MPVGPKPWRVRKMAWSWCSECSGSSFCCTKAQRHTFSKLRDGFPRSMRLMDWEDTIHGIYLALLDNTKRKQPTSSWSIIYGLKQKDPCLSIVWCEFFTFYVISLFESQSVIFSCKNVQCFCLVCLTVPLHSQAWSSWQEPHWCAHLVTRHGISHSPATTYDKKKSYITLQPTFLFLPKPNKTILIKVSIQYIVFSILFPFLQQEQFRNWEWNYVATAQKNIDIMWTWEECFLTRPLHACSGCRNS